MTAAMVRGLVDAYHVVRETGLPAEDIALLLEAVTGPYWREKTTAWLAVETRPIVRAALLRVLGEEGS